MANVAIVAAGELRCTKHVLSVDVKSITELEFTMEAHLSIAHVKESLKSKDTNYSQKNIKVEGGEKSC